MKKGIRVARERANARRHRGFTLIELVVTILVAALLTAIAIPSYNSYVRKARRTEARSALLNLAGLEERYFSTQNSYTNNPADLGYSGTMPIAVGSGYYTVNIPPPGAATAPTNGAPGVPATYIITATVVGGTDQAKDTPCQTFTVNSNGTQTATDSNNADSTLVCWR